MESVTVVYDADCGVCDASVAWVRKRAGAERFVFVGSDQPLPPGVSREETAHTVVVLERGEKFTRASAVAQLLGHLRGWRWVGAVLRAPVVRTLADIAYGQIAKRRHRISAALGLRACLLPPRR